MAMGGISVENERAAPFGAATLPDQIGDKAANGKEKGIIV
jgi:hypothetical protein